MLTQEFLGQVQNKAELATLAKRCAQRVRRSRRWRNGWGPTKRGT